MFLSINEDQVAELLRSSNPARYAVNGLEIPIMSGNTQPNPTAEVFGAVYRSTSEVTAEQEHVFGTHAREAIEIVKDWLGKK